jgi:hypothetical protein
LHLSAALMTANARAGVTVLLVGPDLRAGRRGGGAIACYILPAEKILSGVAGVSAVRV